MGLNQVALLGFQAPVLSDEAFFHSGTLENGPSTAPTAAAAFNCVVTHKTLEVKEDVFSFLFHMTVTEFKQ